MTPEFVATLAGLLLPAVLLLGSLAIVGLGLAGTGLADLQEDRLLRG